MIERLDNIESRLREATVWSGPDTQIWKQAFTEKPESSSSTWGLIKFAKRRWFTLVSVSAAACLALILVISSQFQTVRMAPTADMWTPVRRSNSTLRQLNSASQTDNPNPATDTSAQYDSLNEKSLSYSYQYQANPQTPPQVTAGESAFPLMADTNPYVKGQVASPAASARHVIHKATIELTTPDVRAAFLKAGLILNEGLGEHVQDSSLTGSGESAYANLTLRVVATRLSDVCNALRELGVVVSERREGQDVTGQAIDVEARLRNEQRVEQELLALFDQRRDAPLKDVLDLRQKLSEVRAGIEQLVAQRDQLSRLVSLATVLVIIRTGEKPVEEAKEEGLWRYFGESIKRAWRGGTRGLADTIAALVSIFIGGLIWWVLLVIGLMMLRRYVKARGSNH